MFFYVLLFRKACVASCKCVFFLVSVWCIYYLHLTQLFGSAADCKTIFLKPQLLRYSRRSCFRVMKAGFWFHFQKVQKNSVNKVIKWRLVVRLWIEELLCSPMTVFEDITLNWCIISSSIFSKFQLRSNHCPLLCLLECATDWKQMRM